MRLKWVKLGPSCSGWWWVKWLDVETGEWRKKIVLVISVWYSPAGIRVGYNLDPAGNQDTDWITNETHWAGPIEEPLE